MHPYVHAANTPGKAAVIMAETGETMTYGEMEAYSNRVAQLLRAYGLQRGDKIVLMLENCIDYLPLCWGAQRSGIIFTAMSTKLSLDEAQYIAADSGAITLI